MYLVVVKSKLFITTCFPSIFCQQKNRKFTICELFFCYRENVAEIRCREIRKCFIWQFTKILGYTLTFKYCRSDCREHKFILVLLKIERVSGAMLHSLRSCIFQFSKISARKFSNLVVSTFLTQFLE